MDTSFIDKFTIERNLLYIIIAAVLIVFGFVFYLFYSHFTKNIEVLSPNGREEWRIGESYRIKWDSRGIDRVGIVLFKGAEPKWIAKNVAAGNEEYEWRIHAGQDYRDDYWIAVFEYPWQEGNVIDYSDGAFAVVFPEFATCDGVSLQSEWPYIPSDYPNLRRVFITEEKYHGNLGGLTEADKKCQTEAGNLGYDGEWMAFIGGDSDQETALERVRNTEKGTEGIFVEAQAEAVLLRGDTCHRLLGKNLTEFLEKFSAGKEMNQKSLSETFYQKFGEVWLGRVSAQSKKNCEIVDSVASDPYVNLAEKYTFTATCQNWTRSEKFVEGYPVPIGASKPVFPTCYTPQGKSTDAVASGALGLGQTVTKFTPFQGKYCNSQQRLICIEK